MLPHFIFALGPILSFLPSAAAHLCYKVDIDGTTHPGNVTGAKPSDGPIRQISDINAVNGVNNPSLNCDRNAKLASMVIPINRGSRMGFHWGHPHRELVSAALFNIPLQIADVFTVAT